MITVIKHKFITAITSVGIILFSAGATYFALAAFQFRQLPLITTNPLLKPSCEPMPIGGELIIVFDDDIAEQMQDRIIMANKGTVKSRTYLDTLGQYRDIIKVEPGLENLAATALRQTPGVISVEQNTTTCPM